MHQQRGMSMISLLAVLVVAAVMLKAVFSLMPMYWEHQMITTVLNNMYNAPEVRAEMRPATLKRILEERLSSNDIVVDMSGLSLRPMQRGIELQWDYEMRRTWLGSVDLVVRFSQYKDFSQ